MGEIEQLANVTAEKRDGRYFWPMGDGRYIGVDRGDHGRCVEVEFRWLCCGGIEVIDVRDYPAP